MNYIKKFNITNEKSVLDVVLEHKELKLAFNWVIKNSKSNDLPYHNFNHLLTVVKYVNEACEHYGLSDIETKNLLVAAMFHDVNHTGGKEKDDVNVSNSKKALEEFVNNFSDENLKVSLDEMLEIIDATQFPYVIDAEDLNLSQKIIRDSDLLQVLEYNWIQQNMMGLAEEMNISLDKMIEGQMGFLQGAEFNTEWGENYKEKNWNKVIGDLEKLEELYNFV